MKSIGTYILQLVGITVLGLVLVHCKSTKNPIAREKVQGNNEVIINGESRFRSVNSKDEVIFQGENNKVYIDYLDSFFNIDGSHDVIIIEGDGNIFRLTHQQVIDNSKNSSDTIHLIGNQNHIDYLVAYFMNNSNSSNEKVELVLDDNIKIIETGNVTEFDSSTIENKITKSWMPVNKAFYFYKNEAVKGNMDASFYLGEMYELGVGTKMDMKKAEYYYLIAAKKGHVAAQSSLGYIYANEWGSVSKNEEKAKYWYKKAAAQGDDFAKEELVKME